MSPLILGVRKRSIHPMNKKLPPPDEASVLYAIDPALLQLLVSGGIWRTESVSDAPHIVLESWTIRQLENGDRHFIGWNATHHEGRASSKIVSFDKDTLRGVTRSGRVYELRGKPGTDRDAEHVWASWCRINNVTGWLDVTPDAPGSHTRNIFAVMKKPGPDSAAAAAFSRMCAEKSQELAQKELEQEVPVEKDFGPFGGRRKGAEKTVVPETPTPTGDDPAADDDFGTFRNNRKF